MAPKFRKSEWGGMCCDTDRDRSACRSWFKGFVEDWEGPFAADVLEVLETGATPAMRALFRRSDGQLRVVERRTNKRGWRVSMSPLTAALAKHWSREIAALPSLTPQTEEA